MKRITTTLALVVRDNEILLAMKKRGHGEGHWNGAGGKVDPGETISQAMVRECLEEIGITPTKYEKVAVNTYYQPYKGEPCENTSHNYLVTEWEGEPAESDEMTPRWFSLDEIPYESMWPDVPAWLPQLLAGKKLRSTFHYDDTNGAITSREITEVSSFDES